MNKKKKIIIIVLSVILVLILVLFLINNLNYENKIEKHITNLGFKYNDDTYLYSKQVSLNSYEEYKKNMEEGIDAEYEVMYFNSSTYELIQDKTTYSSDINKNLTSTYNYNNDNLSYIYRINFSNSNVIIEGSYENDSFTCKPIFFYQVDIDDSINTICEKLEFEVMNKYDEANTLFGNSKMQEYMKKNK